MKGFVRQGQTYPNSGVQKGSSAAPSFLYGVNKFVTELQYPGVDPYMV